MTTRALRHIFDNWQHKGLGTLLIVFCLQVAHNWGRSRVHAETTPDNSRMRSLFHTQGLRIDRHERDCIRLSRDLCPRTRWDEPVGSGL